MSDTLILVDALSFADEVPTNEDKITQADCVYTDTINAPFASVKIFYRPRGGSFVSCLS